MRQFDIFRNPDAASARRRPYVVVLQSDLLSGVGTVVVAPLALPERTNAVSRLTPIVDVAGSRHVMLIHDLAAIERRVLKRTVGTAAAMRDEILAAIDLVFIGF